MVSVCVLCWNLVTLYVLGLLQHVWCAFMPKFVLGNEFAIRCRNWVFWGELVFSAEWGVLQRIVICCRNWVVCSGLAFAAEMYVLQRICDSLSELSRLQRNCDSLPKLRYLQRISIRCHIACSAANLWFAVEVEMSAAELWFAVEMCVLQQITFAAEMCVLQRNCDSLPKLSWLHRSSIRCRIASSTTNLWFAAEIELSAAK